MDNADTNIIVVLVGNKCDLEDSREVAYEEAEEYARQHGMAFIETSALDSTNVEMAFLQTITSINSKIQAQLRHHEDFFS